MKLSLCIVFMSLITSFQVSANKLSERSVLDIKREISPFAYGYLKGKYPDFCPFLVHPNNMDIDKEKTSEDKVTFSFLFGSPYSYCNDGAPVKCEIVVFRLRDGSWDTDDPFVECSE